MKNIEIEDDELKFLIEACRVVNVPGSMAKALVALLEKLTAAMPGSTG